MGIFPKAIGSPPFFNHLHRAKHAFPCVIVCCYQKEKLFVPFIWTHTATAYKSFIKQINRGFSSWQSCWVCKGSECKKECCKSCLYKFRGCLTIWREILNNVRLKHKSSIRCLLNFIAVLQSSTQNQFCKGFLDVRKPRLWSKAMGVAINRISKVILNVTSH